MTPPSRRRLALVTILALIAGLDCSGEPKKNATARQPRDETPRSAKEVPSIMKLTSPAFAAEGEIPARYTCQGDDVSPALAWSAVPEDARSLVLIVDDPDAPDPAAPKMTWVHWVLYNLPARDGGLAEDVSDAELPAGTRVGRNDWKRADYGGPCPPIGRHRYFFKLYALDRELPEMGHPPKQDVEKAMAGHILTQATLMGTYEKH